MVLENAFALLIGVGEDLPITVADSEAIRDLLIDPARGAYPKDNVVCLTNELASRASILKALDTLVEKANSRENATVVVYYSGHGALFYNTGDDPAFFLKTFAHDENDRENTMVSGEEFSDRINQIKAEKLIVMLDCCHASGMNLDVGLIKKGSKAIKQKRSQVELMQKMQGGKGRVFLASCDDHEESLIFPDAKNSLFTTVMLETLNGIADPRSEFVAALDLVYWVGKEVPKRVEEFVAKNPMHSYLEQNPVIDSCNLRQDYFVCKNHMATLARGKLKSIGFAHSKSRPLLLDRSFRNDQQVAKYPAEGFGDLENVFDRIQLGKESTNSDKVTFVNKIGGMANLNKLHGFLASNEIEVIKLDVQKGINLKDDANDIFTNKIEEIMEKEQKLKFINNYSHKLNRRT